MRALGWRLKNPRVVCRLNLLDLHAIHRDIQPGHAVRTCVVRGPWDSGEIRKHGGLLEFLSAAVVRAAELVIPAAASSETRHP